MSLLMDALRKAEADKKQAANVEPEAIPEEVVESADPSSLASESIPPSRPISGQYLTLEPLDLSGLPNADDAAPPLDRRVGPDDPTIADVAVEMSADPAAREIEFESVDPLAAALESVRQESGVAPTGDATQLYQTNSGLRETVATANTVFEARGSGSSKSLVFWGLVTVVLLTTALGVAGFYYLQQAPAPHTIPSPAVALNVEKPLPRTLPTPQPPRTMTALAPHPNSAYEEPPLLATTSESAVLGTDAGTAAPGTALVEKSEPAEPEFTLVPRTEYLTVTDRPPIPTTPIARATAPLHAPEIGVRPGEVRIARSVSSRNADALVSQAYTAYVAGEFGPAQELYDSVLAQNPQHRDALLGSAALKLQGGDVAAAHRLYNSVLAMEPNNPTASAALFSIEGGVGDQVTESRLKMLLDEGVDVGFVYFSLGNLYARNKRWADAQQAYFEALRNNPSNPDYNYNLAVSLDRIGQRSAAAKYYTLALDLTDGIRPGFDTAEALARVNAISASVTP